MAVEQRKLAIIAGGGTLPARLAETCKANGRPYVVLALKGFADLDLKPHPHHWILLGEAGKTIETLGAEGAKDLVFCGRLTRPNFRDIRVDWVGMKLLPRLAAAGARGDDGLLGFIVKEMEGRGFRVVGPNEVLAELLAVEGNLTTLHPNAEQLGDIARGREVVTAMGKLDIGQGVVVARHLVLAVEAAQGTDEMLRQVGALPADLRGSPQDRRGVLVKMPKPGQERRIDLPAIGVDTITNAFQAGLAGIAVEAGGALILDRDTLIAAANKAGMFVCVFPKEAH